MKSGSGGSIKGHGADDMSHSLSLEAFNTSGSMCWRQFLSLSLKQEAVGITISRMDLQLLLQADHFSTFAKKEWSRETMFVNFE